MKIIQSIIVVAKTWPLRALWWQERVQLVYHPLALRKQKDRKPDGTVTLRLVPFYPRWSVPLAHFPKVLQLRLVEWAWLYRDTLSPARPHALTVPQISRLSPSEDQGFKHMTILGEQLTFKPNYCNLFVWFSFFKVLRIRPRISLMLTLGSTTKLHSSFDVPFTNIFWLLKESPINSYSRLYSCSHAFTHSADVWEPVEVRNSSRHRETQETE